VNATAILGYTIVAYTVQLKKKRERNGEAKYKNNSLYLKLGNSLFDFYQKYTLKYR